MVGREVLQACIRMCLDYLLACLPYVTLPCLLGYGGGILIRMEGMGGKEKGEKERNGKESTEFRSLW